LTPEESEELEKIISKSNGKFNGCADFGKLAIEYYLKHIEEISVKEE
jgi:hypothetical protein